MVSSGCPDFTHDGPGTSAAAWEDRPEWAGVPDLEPLEAGYDRVVVAAAHPDDESLGAGGLVAQLRSAGVPVSLVLATAGEGSHPRSPTVPPAALASWRRGEAARAWELLGGEADEMSFWDLPDGSVHSHEDEAVRRLVDAVGDGRSTLLVTPWRLDGHPDHDALGRAGRVAAYRTGARHLQYPVWFWHHGRPTVAPWSTFVLVRLAARDVDRKAAAIAAHVSQVAALSPHPGDEQLLGPGVLAHFGGGREVFIDEEPADAAFDALHAEHEDPWGTRTRWYEERRQDLILAALPRPRYRRGLDVGCSVGTLTGALAERCDAVVATERSAVAVAAARARLSDRPWVDVRRAEVPREWPEGRFDLVVVSESGYFLSPAALDSLVERVGRCLTPDGSLLLAHWRHDIVGWPLDGPEVHRRFAECPTVPPVVARYVDRDVEVVVHAAADTLPGPG